MAMLHGCEIGDGSLIGIGSTILNGVKIGHNCLIGAHTLIPEGKIIPDNSMVLGTPGQVVKTVTIEQLEEQKKAAAGYVRDSNHFKRHCHLLDTDLQQPNMPAPEKSAPEGNTTFQSQGDMMASVAWTRLGDSGKRDWKGMFSFFKSDAPTSTVKTEWGVFEDVVQPFGDFAAEQCFAKSLTTIVDARTHFPGGKDGWDLQENGFCFLQRPEYAFEEHEQQDFRRCNKEFAPKVLESVRKAAGASRALWLSHIRRGEPSVRKVGIVADG